MKLLRSIAFLSALIAVLTGCGGGGSQPATRTGVGRATFTIHWPAPSRLIPVASNSIKITLTGPGSSSQTLTIARPQTSVTFNALPVGDYSATSLAFPASDGTGVAQAQATVPVIIQDGQNTAFSLTMASTIVKLDIPPAFATPPPTGAPTWPQVFAGTAGTLNVVATDAAGSIVLTAGSKVTWQSSNAAAVALLDANGQPVPSNTTVTGNSVPFRVITGGNANGRPPSTGLTAGITVTETESGKSAAVPLNVRPVGVVVTNPDSTIASAGTEQFTANVTNSLQGVQWRISSFTPVNFTVDAGFTGGTIDQNGLYTAPVLPVQGLGGPPSLIVTIQATSIADPSISGTATITVQ
jgi:hypothetical protein